MDIVMPAAISFSLLFFHSEAAAPLRELILIVNNSPAFEYILKDTIQPSGSTIRTYIYQVTFSPGWMDTSESYG